MTKLLITVIEKTALVIIDTGIDDVNMSFLNGKRHW